jgi:branched-chain amino acid transport system permease protein
MSRLLEARDLCAYYGPTQVLFGLGLAVDEGGITTLLGANGAGKTTTLRSLSGMCRTNGDIRFDGKAIAGRATEDIVRLGIAHVPQGRGTFSRQTVEENLEIGAMTRHGRAAIAADVERVYGYFPRLKERRGQQAGTLSGGEQQMLAVGRAMMLRPRLMLLDEPSFGLAPLIVEELFGILRTLNKNEKVSMLLVEQNAALALDLADHAYLIETGRLVTEGPARQLRDDENIRRSYLATDGTADGTVSASGAGGLATGGIYACMALAVVMIYQAIDHLNFAQGEMAMFSTFIAWQLIQWGFPYWLAFGATIVISFAAGVVIERVVLKPIHDAPVLSHVVAFIALLAILNSSAGFLWDWTIKSFASPFGSGQFMGQNLLSKHDAGMIGVTLLMLVALYLFFRHTRIGLAMRAAAANPESARLAGIRVGWMNALGWGMAAAIGAVAGMLIAPVVFLEPNMMLSILLYGFGRRGGRRADSPGGAVFGGFSVGVIENLAGPTSRWSGAR